MKLFILKMVLIFFEVDEGEKTYFNSISFMEILFL